MTEEDKDKINKEEENKVDENQPKDESTSNNEQTWAPANWAKNTAHVSLKIIQKVVFLIN